MAKTYIGLHPNDLNRTDYGEIVLYVEGVPVAFFSGSGDVTISGSLAIEGITNVSASIAAVGNNTGSLMVTGSVNGDTITFTKGDGTTFQVTVNNVASASHATVALSASFANSALSASFANSALSASFATTASFAITTVSASYATTASLAARSITSSVTDNVFIKDASGLNIAGYLAFSTASGYTGLNIDADLYYSAQTNTLRTSFFSGSFLGTASYANFAATASRALTMSFDGNRPVTQPLLPDLVNYNPGTSTVVDFLNQVFYPDPGFGIDILTNEPYYILETELSGSHVRGTTVAGSPAVSYYLQYGTASFSSNTAVTWSLQPNSVLDIQPSTGKLFIKVNFSASALLQAPASIAGTVVATSTGGGFATRPFTVTVLDNFAPTIDTSNITNFTPKAASFVTASGALIGIVYINEPGDPAGPPTITTMAGADANKFTLTQTNQLADATYYNVTTAQGLNSGSYTLQFTGSDVHGQIATGSVTFSIAANTPPVLSVFSGFNVLIQNVSSGSTYGEITVTDNIGDAINTFTLSGPDAGNFAVLKTLSNMGSLTSNGTFISTTGTERYSVKFATAPEVKQYNITASATDNFALASHTGSLAIVNAVSASAPGVFSPNGTFFVIESAVSGAFITTATSGIPGTQAQLTTNQPVSWSIDDPTGNLFISGSNIGRLSLVGNLSGSAFQNGNVLVADVTATNPFSQTRTQTISVSITDNVPANIALTSTSRNNFLTAAGSRTTFGTITITDPQSIENVRLIGIGGPNGSSFTTSSASPAQTVVHTISSSVDLNSGSYVVGFTASDSYGQLTFATQTYVVTPNNPPTISPTTFSKDITLATSGSTIGQLTVSDGDALEGLASTTLSGTDASKFDLVEVSGTTTKIFNLKADENLTAGGFNVTASAVDNFGNTTAQPLTITVTVEAPSIPTANGQFFIIESAVSGSDVTTASSGIAGTKAKFTTNQTVTWSLQSGAALAISQSGELTIKVPMSGSATFSVGSVIADRVIATNQFNASENFDFQVLVTDDEPPVITNTLAGKNNNKTTTATGFGTIVVSDPQSLGNVTITSFGGPNVGSFTFTPGTAGSTRTYTVSSSAALNSGSYTFNATASDAYAQTASASFSIIVAENLKPVVSLTGFAVSLDQATSGSSLGTVSISDPQDDSIASFTLSGTDSSKFATNLLSSTATTAQYRVSAAENLTTGSFNLTGSATDSFGLTTVTSIPVTVTSTAPAVPIQNAIGFFIIESALSGSNVVVNSDGFTGVQADMNTDQFVNWSVKAPSTFLAIDSNGGLSVKTNISGSAKNASGAPFNLISEYVVATNLVGGSSEALVNVQVAANLPPALTYTGLTVNEGSANAGNTVGTVTATDPQSLDSITSVIISGGANAGSFTLVQTGTTAYTKSYNINVSGSNLAAGSYSIQLTGRDSFNKTTAETKTVTVNSVAATNTVYVYGSTRGATSINSEASAISALGDPGADKIAIVANSPIAKFTSGSIGSGSIAVPGGTVALIKTGSLPTLTDLNTLGDLNFSAAIQQIIILFPSGSTIGAQPSSMYDGVLPAGSPVANRYTLYDKNTTIPGVVASGIYYFDTLAPKDGFSNWGMIFSESGNSNNATFFIVPDSGSAPI